MERRRKYVLFRCFAAVLCFLTVFLCCGFRESPRKGIVVRKDPYDPYRQVLVSSQKYWEKTGSSNFFHALKQGSVLECFDLQALPAVKAETGKYWYPQCMATVVIAVDRNRTAEPVKGWKDLLRAEGHVGWCASETDERLFLGALGYGLEGKDFSSLSALNYLNRLKAQERFQYGEWDQPFQICYDFQAAELARRGRNIEIIIPEEGTCSFALGLLSNQLLDIVSDDALLAGGLRLADGRCTDEVYPAKEEYLRAVSPEDTEHFLEETEYSRRDFRRQVLHTRLFSSADGTEHVLYALICVILTLTWMRTAMHRSIRTDIQRAVRTACVLIVCWLMVRLWKYQLPDGYVLARYCWYAYYIFQLALPLVLLYISTVIDKTEGERHFPLWEKLIFLLYPFLLLLVFTNDLHQLVFRFRPDGNWSDVYTRGIGFAAIYAYNILTFLTSVVLLVRKSLKSPKKFARYVPLLFCGLIFLYSTGYIMGVPVARDSDVTTTVCILAVLFLETALRTGLIPSNTRYGVLFSSSPLSMQLLNGRGQTVLASDSADELEPVLRVQLQSRMGSSVNRDRDTVYFGRAVHGGTVVWQEDLSTLNRLHREIQASVERLEAANTLLRKEGEVRKRKLAADVKAELFHSLQNEIEEKTKELSEAITELPHAEDKERQTAYIMLLLCHIKRRCNLFFLAKEGDLMAGDELAMYLDELSEFAGYAGVHTLVRCGEFGFMDIRTATLCYDFYFSVLSWSVQKSSATLLGQLVEQEGMPVFRILSSEKTDTLEFSASFVRAAEAAGGRAFCRTLEETEGIYLSFEKGENSGG